jgi:hypothetical protein
MLHPVREGGASMIRPRQVHEAGERAAPGADRAPPLRIAPDRDWTRAIRP